jgi:hypothetical protein
VLRRLIPFISTSFAKKETSMKSLTKNATTIVEPAGTQTAVPQTQTEQSLQTKPTQAQCCAKASPTVAGCHD